jgi:hypothetical protein
MRALKLGLCGALVVILAGCDSVWSPIPLGEAPLQLEESEWKGTWLHADGALTVRVVDAGQGRIEVGSVEEKKGSLVLETVEIHLRKAGEWIIASFADVEDEAEGGAPRYLWGRLERDGEQVFLWWPRPAEFRRLVEAGLLPGNVEGGDVILGTLEDEHLAVILSEEHGILFEWDAPMAFHRYQRE